MRDAFTWIYFMAGLLKTNLRTPNRLLLALMLLSSPVAAFRSMSRLVATKTTLRPAYSPALLRRPR